MEERMVTVNQVKRVVPIVEQLENYYAQIAQLDQRCEVIKEQKADATGLRLCFQHFSISSQVFSLRGSHPLDR